MTAPAFHWVEHGEGPTVVLIHGLSASMHAWDAVAATPGFRFVKVDLPGHGRSGPWERFDPRAIAPRLVDELSAGGPAYVVGHSFGGLVALELAARAPKLVRGVCAIAAPAMGFPSIGPFVGTALAERFMRIARHARPSVRAVRAYLEFMWGDGPKPTAGHVQGYLLSMEADGHHQALLEAARSVAAYELPHAALTSGLVPLTLIAGDRDRLVPLSHAQRLARRLFLDVQVVRGAGHFLPEERPEVIVRHLRAAHRQGGDAALSA